MELTFLRKKNSSKIGNGKIKQIHLINSTNIGGTEKTLEKYLHSISLETPIIIYTFQPMGQIGQNLINKNFDIRAPIKVGWFSLVLHVLKLLVKLAGSKNFIIVSWMYQTHLLSLILNFITRDTEVVWHFRSDISQYQEGTITKRASLKIICLFSDKCSKAIFNSKKGKQNHLASGICAKQNFVIYNPICTDEIRHNFET